MLAKIFTQKSKKIAWFASNCKSNSRREELVSKIQQHIPVDIYGKCGTYKCEKNSEKCNELLRTNYMFYLSFENALCKDYVTEKLYRALDEFIIPIVFNGANTSLYAPPNSYIDANDFENVDDLIAFLKEIMSDSQKYLEYFWWKKYYFILYDVPIFQYGFCELCMRLQDNRYLKQSHLVQDINGWWNDGGCTKKSWIKF